MGLVISTFGDNLQAELPVWIPVLADWMGSEMTRLAAVKAFAVIAASPLNINLLCVLEHLIAKLTAFLQKASLVVAHGDKIASFAYKVETFSSFYEVLSSSRQFIISFFFFDGILYKLTPVICQMASFLRPCFSCHSDSDLHMMGLALALVFCSTWMTDRDFHQEFIVEFLNFVMLRHPGFQIFIVLRNVIYTDDGIQKLLLNLV
ncbi:hypothetical protein MKW92_015015 [Papaver armeniacum]|nr:hypothetical protein MKW92_015015 [Papaver armeniacum]